MNLLFAVTASQFFQAFCWTLVHSLWQGLVAALMAGIVFFFTRTSPAAVRYKWFLSVLALFLVATGITLFYQLGHAITMDGDADQAVSTFNQLQGNSMNPHSVNGGTETMQAPFSYSFTNYLNDHALTIVFIWFVFFLLKSVQLVAGLHYVHRIRYSQNKPVSMQWKDKLDHFARQMGITSSVVFLQSSLVKVPVVIGLLKPAILVPVGLLNNLPPEQVEAVLLHELAHVRRNDFFVNLLQSVAEVIFFFNPAIVWISGCIREEREACCDDIVLLHSSRKDSYLEALVYFQEYSMQGYAMAFTGKRNYLLNRVKRMLTQENKKLNTMEKILLLSGLAVTMAFGVISKEEVNMPVAIPLMVKPTLTEEHPITVRKGTEKLVTTKTTRHGIAQKDTVPAPKKNQGTTYPNISTNTNDDGRTRTTVTEATDNQGKKYRIKRVDGDIKEFSVNGVMVPKDQYDDYESVIGEIESHQRVRNAKAREEMDLHKAYLQERRQQLEHEKEILAAHRQQEKEEMIRMRKELAEKQQLIEQEQREEMRRQKETIRQTEALHEKMELRSESIRNSSKEEMANLIGDLQREKLISDPENFNFSLTNDGLTVNGKAQSDELHRRLKEKYLRSPGDRIIYSRSGNTVNQTISRD